MGNEIFGASPWLAIPFCIGCVIIEIIIDGLFASIVNKVFPSKWFNENNPHFKVSKKQQRFYDKLKIKKWKDLLPELGGLGGFSKSKLKDSSDPEYIRQFIIENNKGVITHIDGMIFGFLLVALFPFRFALMITIPVSIVNFVLNIFPTMALKYNTPKLQIIYQHLCRQKKLQQEKNKGDNQNVA